MADNDPTAALEEIRERYEYLGPLYQNPHFMLDAVVQDVPRLLAAVEAVLELAEPPDPDKLEYDLDGPIGFEISKAKVREAISRELTGKEEGDAVR